MPRILRIINRLNLGGPTYNAAYLTKFLSSRYETILLAGMKDETEASSEFILEQLGVKPKYIRGMYRAINFQKDWEAYREIKKIIKDFKPDIVHTHAAKSGAVGRLAAKHSNVPVIVHTFHGHVFHSYFNPLKTKLFINIERYLASISTKIIAISNLQKQELAEQFQICSAEKIDVIPLGFDLERFQKRFDEKRNIFRKKFAIKDDEIAIGIIGRLVPVKNHAMFIRAFKKVLERTSKKVKALIIGDGEEREKITNLVKQQNISFDNADDLQNNPLIFTSWIHEIDEAMAGLDIVALTSFNEGTPVSLIEAQASNKAIVSTAVGGIEDVVLEGETALLSKNDDTEKFSENLLKLIENDELRNNFGRNGYLHVNEKFGVKRLVADVENLYDDLLNSL